jgi:uncharacterized protein YkwD
LGITIPSVPLPPAARIALASIVLLAALMVAAARPGTADAGTSRSEAKLLRVINDVRRDHGAHRLRVAGRLQGAAHRWARYLRTHNAFYHGRLAAGTAENIGWVTCRRRWARALTRMWLASASHRPHLLDRSARRIGVGVSKGNWSGYGCVRMAVTRFR